MANEEKGDLKGIWISFIIISAAMILIPYLITVILFNLQWGKNSFNKFKCPDIS